MSTDDRPTGMPPAEALRQELAAFRADHPVHRLTAGATEWTYLSAGAGTEVLVVLPGALGADFAFRLVARLEREFRVLVAIYPQTRQMAEILDGLAALLDHERVRAAHVLGGSYGGLIGQAFVRAYPDRVESLILSHTAPPDAKLAKRNAPLFWLVSKLPETWLKRLFQKKLQAAFVPIPAAERKFWTALLREGVGSMSKAELLDRARLTSDWMRGTRFKPEDLSTWSGRILIIEGEGDPFVPPASQAALRTLYPQAAVHRFEGTGHSSSLVKTDEFGCVVVRFVSNGAAVSVES